MATTPRPAAPAKQAAAHGRPCAPAPRPSPPAPRSSSWRPSCSPPRATSRPRSATSPATPTSPPVPSTATSATRPSCWPRPSAPAPATELEAECALRWRHLARRHPPRHQRPLRRAARAPGTDPPGRRRRPHRRRDPRAAARRAAGPPRRLGRPLRGAPRRSRHRPVRRRPRRAALHLGGRGRPRCGRGPRHRAPLEEELGRHGRPLRPVDDTAAGGAEARGEEGAPAPPAEPLRRGCGLDLIPTSGSGSRGGPCRRARRRGARACARRGCCA